MTGRILLCLALCLIAIGFGDATIPFSEPQTAKADEQRNFPVTADQLKNAPLTIAASEVGRFAKGKSWNLSVNSAGQAELMIRTFPTLSVKQFNVSKEQIAEFRKALVEERFFELEDEYGEVVVDGSTQSITVTAGLFDPIGGARSNTVKIHFLMNWVHSDRSKLREPSRAVRLLVMLRGWFDDERAVDLRKYDQMVLDAAEK